jgi:hypothetical protein
MGMFLHKTSCSRETIEEKMCFIVESRANGEAYQFGGKFFFFVTDAEGKYVFVRMG